MKNYDEIYIQDIETVYINDIEFEDTLLLFTKHYENYSEEENY